MKKLILLIVIILLISDNIYAENYLYINLDTAIDVVGRRKKRQPQIAIWLENKKGDILQNIYVSDFAYKIFKAKGARRKYALPVWVKKQNGELPEDVYSPNLKIINESNKSNIDVDAVSSATPKNKYIIQYTIPPSFLKQELLLKIEINYCYDYNDTYNKQNSSSNGQPSLILEGFISIENNEIKMKAIGHGHLKGQDGNINSNLKDLDIIEKFIKSIKVKIKKKIKI